MEAYVLCMFPQVSLTHQGIGIGIGIYSSLHLHLYLSFIKLYFPIIIYITIFLSKKLIKLNKAIQGIPTLIYITIDISSSTFS